MADKNFISIASNPSGELFLDDPRTQQPPALIRVAGDLSMKDIELDFITPPPGYADALKVSGAVNVNVTVKGIDGGSEDCIDINHSTGVLVAIDEAHPHGKFVATIKGGSANIHVLVDRLIGHGSETDFDLGNWSDQSNAKTALAYLRVGQSDDGTARCRILNAETPSLNGGVRWVVNSRWRVLFLPVMTILKKLHLA